MRTVNELSERDKAHLANKLAESMMGGNSIGHASLLRYAFEEFQIQEMLDWDEALEFCKDQGVEIDECPCCGWVSDGNYYDHQEYAEGVCSDCEVL